MTAEHPWLAAWLAIGRDNDFICTAHDPPFSERSFTFCETFDELATWLEHGNWSLGSAFVLGELCFINQIDGGRGEWLAIRRDIQFESLTYGWFADSPEGRREKLLRHVTAFLAASDDGLRNGDWYAAMEHS